jgi:hypothetical protein
MRLVSKPPDRRSHEGQESGRDADDAMNLILRVVLFKYFGAATVN